MFFFKDQLDRICDRLKQTLRSRAIRPHAHLNACQRSAFIPRQICKACQQNQAKDLSYYFPLYEIKDFMAGKVCVVYVEKLDDDMKYVFYKGEAYKRKISGDYKLKKAEIEAQNELREEIRTARELNTVDNATLNDLDVNKLNDYVIRLNRDINPKSGYSFCAFLFDS